MVGTAAEPLNSTSRTESRCLNRVESRSMQEETGCRAHQLEVIVCGEQRWATNASMQHVLLSCARAEASLRLTGDAAGRGSDAHLAAALLRSAGPDSIDSLLWCVVLPEALTLRSMSLTKLASTLLQPRGLLVLMHSVTRLGSHRPHGYSNSDWTAVNMQIHALAGASAQCVWLPTRRSTAGARVRPLLLAAKM